MSYTVFCAVIFFFRLSIYAWLSFVGIAAGILVFLQVKRMRESVCKRILCSVAAVLALAGLLSAFHRGSRLYFLSLLADEEDDWVEMAAAHIDKHWSADEIVHCFESVVAGDMPFTREDRKQLMLFLPRLLARKDTCGTTSAIERFENLARTLPNIYPVVYHEYGYTEGIRTFWNDLPNGSEHGLNIHDVYRHFRDKENGPESLLVPFPVKNIGGTDHGIYAAWSLRNRSSSSQSMHLSPTSAGKGFRLDYWCSNNDSLQMANDRLFRKIPSEGKVVTVPPHAVLWIQAWQDECSFTGAFTNAIVLAISDGATNTLSISGEAIKPWKRTIAIPTET